MKKVTSIEARSLVAGRNLEPYVHIVLRYEDGTEDVISQWTPNEAYNHVQAVVGAVEAANTDAFLVSFLVNQLSMPLDEIGKILEEFRQWRERGRTPERTM